MAKSWTVVVLGMAVGCGPAVGAPQAGGTGSTGGDSDAATAADDGSGDAEAGPGSVGSDATGVDDNGSLDDSTGGSDDGSTGGDPPLGLCGTPPGQPLGVASTHDDPSAVSLIYGDGFSTALEVGDASIPSGANIRLGVAANAESIVVSLGWAQLPAHGEVTHAFTHDGTQLFKRVEVGAELRDLALGDDGNLVALRAENGRGFAGLVTDGRGSEDQYPDFHPAGSIDALGRIAGRQVLGRGAGTLGWMDTTTGEFDAAVESADTIWNARFEDGFAYIAGGSIVVEDVGAPQVTALGSLADAHVTSMAGSWALLRAYDPRTEISTWGRVDLGSGVVEGLDLSAPAGVEHLLCYEPVPVIDASGAILLPMRDASVAQLYRLVPGAGWTAVGEPVTDVEMMTVYAPGDAVVIETLGPGNTFCPQQSYEPIDGVIAGGQRQVALPELDITRVLAPESWGFPRADGLCVTETTAETSLQVHDLVSGDSLTLPPDTGFVFLP